MKDYPTVRITRRKAKELILISMIGDISDTELVKFMDTYLADSCRRCVIVSDNEEDNNDEDVE